MKLKSSCIFFNSSETHIYSFMTKLTLISQNFSFNPDFTVYAVSLLTTNTVIPVTANFNKLQLTLVKGTEYKVKDRLEAILIRWKYKITRACFTIKTLAGSRILPGTDRILL